VDDTALPRKRRLLGFWEMRRLEAVGLRALEASNPNPIFV
jgi:hypothetical protein